ncbi:MAG: hypothetical protein CVU81_03450 [Euryarchaeota archaeon HGW-Euryarchaeota-1]|nr:MAG: hypothetical protein CVU81_03450 [Euryarchaeota archaeon HGW-Euryarchaeota-1]
MVELLTIFSLVLVFISLYFSTIFLLLYFKNKKHIYNEPQVPKKLPRVSVLTPVFNEEKTITATLDSIIALHYPKDLLEVIVINDGSTDGTRAIAERYAQHYNYIKVLNKTNSGKADSLNRGIKIAKGEFFVVLDADSYIHPEAIYKSIGFFSDVTHGVGCIFRTSIIKKIGGYDIKNITEDMEIAWRINRDGYKIKNIYTVINTTTVPNNFKSLFKQRIRWILGAFQNLIKYRYTFLKSQYNQVGTTIYSFVLFNYIFLFSGLSLLAYSAINQFFSEILSINYIISSNLPFVFYFDFLVSGLTALTLGVGLIFLFFLYISFKSLHINAAKYYKLFLPFIFFFPLFTGVVAITSIYKLAKGDIRWFK